MNPGWQQEKLKQYCSKEGIFITAYSPLGGQVTFGNPNPVMTCDVLKEIAGTKRKTIAQVKPPLKFYHSRFCYLLLALCNTPNVN
jgi:3''-deamino-3''-oxonicotianamine reductase